MSISMLLIMPQNLGTSDNIDMFDHDFGLRHTHTMYLQKFVEIKVSQFYHFKRSISYIDVNY